MLTLSQFFCCRVSAAHPLRRLSAAEDLKWQGTPRAASEAHMLCKSKEHKGLETGESEATQQQVMTSDEASAEILKRYQERQAELERSVAGDVDPNLQYALAALSLFGVVLVVIFLYTTLTENSGRQALPSYTETCGTEANRLKQFFFPGSGCVELDRAY
eukprot:CAMPEP_0171098788 /NCGR_PEP_ID=MMETSP0766_2-20121228/49534_1 /TAXON_ID=439317 /ORGANISM="Gambierdiscus australes, Strain CAWD 149" /LENGTH=159 /DNA_ID=CAMNT_0011558241 /DNA_START=175 /DNA_END=655 /DNA_ORIENTATION=+